MIGLVSLLVTGCLIVGVCIYVLFFRMPDTHGGQLQPVEIELNEIIHLRSLEFTNFSHLFSDSDYRMLLSESRLVRAAENLKRDRRRLALQWLAVLRSDVVSLWRLRRLLTSYGISQDVRAELLMTGMVVLILGSIAILRMCVFIVGPFTVSTATFKLRRNVETYIRCCRAALGRLPKTEWPAFSAKWREQQASAA